VIAHKFVAIESYRNGKEQAENVLTCIGRADTSFSSCVIENEKGDTEQVENPLFKVSLLDELGACFRASDQGSHQELTQTQSTIQVEGLNYDKECLEDTQELLRDAKPSGIDREKDVVCVGASFVKNKIGLGDSTVTDVQRRSALDECGYGG